MRKLTMERIHMLLFFILTAATGSVWLLYVSLEGPRGLDIGTNNGIIRGTRGISRDGKEFYAWMGIPYAQPPVGPLRFEDPRPMGRWSHVWDATYLRGWCAQAFVMIPFTFGSEDCLYLNVYVPRKPTFNGLPYNMSVIFYIHGGAFVVGGGVEQGPEFFMDEDVILVTLNYRLGIFGFLSTGDTVIRGNMGLKDQVMALKWIHENIYYFGGNPNSITLAGESAGGASVIYQMIAQKANGMFHRALALSGAAGSSWSIISAKRMKKLVHRVANIVNCPAGNSWVLVECLKAQPARYLLQAVKTDTADSYLFSPHLDGETFVPTIEVVRDQFTFLDKYPLQAFKSQQVYEVPLMIGMMADEGLLGSLAFYASLDNMYKFESDLIRNIRKVCGLPAMNFQQILRSTNQAIQIKDYYFPNYPIMTSDQKLTNFTTMFSDCFFNYWVHEAASLYREYATVHLYIYTRDKGPSLAPIQVGISGQTYRVVEGGVSLAQFLFRERIMGRLAEHNYGVSHADDIWMMFPLYPVDIFRVNRDHPGYSFSKDFIQLLLDFAEDRKPLLFGGLMVDQPFDRDPHEGEESCMPMLSVNDTPSIIPDPFHPRLAFLRHIGVGYQDSS